MSTLAKRVEALEAAAVPLDDQRLEDGWNACWAYAISRAYGTPGTPPTEEQRAAFAELAEKSQPHREYLENLQKVFGPIAEKMQAEREAGKSVHAGSVRSV